MILDSFWLNGHLDNACIDKSNCQANDILWEDAGPVFDQSIYHGWMDIHIGDDPTAPCLKVVSMTDLNKC